MNLSFLPAADTSEPLLSWWSEFVDGYNAGYGGAKPIKPIPQDMPEYERHCVLIQWVTELVRHGSIGSIPPNMPPVNMDPSMHLGEGSMLDAIPGASLMILKCQAQFATSMLELYTYSRELNRNNFRNSEDVRRTFDSAIKAYMWLSAVEESIKIAGQRPGWIDRRIRDFLLDCINTLDK